MHYITGFCPELIQRSISDTAWLNFSWVQLFYRVLLERDAGDLALVLVLPLKNSSESDPFKYELDYIISLLKALQWLPISLREKSKSLQCLQGSMSSGLLYLSDHIFHFSPLYLLLVSEWIIHTDFWAVPQIFQTYFDRRVLLHLSFV